MLNTILYGTIVWLNSDLIKRSTNKDFIFFLDVVNETII